jgi:hypothetical protein
MSLHFNHETFVAPRAKENWNCERIFVVEFASFSHITTRISDEQFA